MRKDQVDRKLYDAVHAWLKRKYGVATSCVGATCTKKSTNYQWALKKGCVYDWERENFIQLCVSCHVKYDFTEEARINHAKSNFHSNKTHCHRGHPFSKENTFVEKGKYRGCRTCRIEYKRKWRKQYKAHDLEWQRAYRIKNRERINKLAVKNYHKQNAARSEECKD